VVGDPRRPANSYFKFAKSHVNHRCSRILNAPTSTKSNLRIVSSDHYSGMATTPPDLPIPSTATKPAGKVTPKRKPLPLAIVRCACVPMAARSPAYPETTSRFTRFRRRSLRGTKDPYRLLAVERRSNEKDEPVSLKQSQYPVRQVLGSL